jgi:hypothetical protein
MLQTCIREVLALSFGYGTCYTDCFCSLTQLYTIIFQLHLIWRCITFAAV